MFLQQMQPVRTIVCFTVSVLRAGAQYTRAQKPDRVRHRVPQGNPSLPRHASRLQTVLKKPD